MEVKDLQQYEIIINKHIEEVNSNAYLLKHKKTGARVVILSNDDDNKVFNIGFRTPVTDDTGVPHIIEHTVLCGSDDFPVKEPFMELVKGSLNTFLNAMTYPDKTVILWQVTTTKILTILCMFTWMLFFIRISIRKKTSLSRKAGITN